MIGAVWRSRSRSRSGGWLDEVILTEMRDKIMKCVILRCEPAMRLVCHD